MIGAQNVPAGGFHDNYDKIPMKCSVRPLGVSDAEGGAGTPGEVHFNLATSGSARSDLAPVCLAPQPAASYKMLAAGEAACPPGKDLSSFDECKAAITSLIGAQNVPAGGFHDNYDKIPMKCSVRPLGVSDAEGGAGTPGEVHFNLATSGSARSDLAPVCLADVADTASAVDDPHITTFEGKHFDMNLNQVHAHK